MDGQDEESIPEPWHVKEKLFDPEQPVPWPGEDVSQTHLAHYLEISASDVYDLM